MKYLLLLLALTGCSAAMPTPAQQAEVASFGTQLTECVVANETDEAAAACQCAVAKRFNRQVETLCP
jgi:hypothetical protein